MDYREALSAAFPPRRSDEPAGLREDILDELADHLTCSYHHELLRGADSAAARARALERFGDPAAVARRLWLDAMKGRIMAKRVLIATCVMLTCASLSLAAVFWLRSNRAEAAMARALALAEAERRMAEDALAESNRRLTDSLAQNQLASAEMLKQLKSVSDAVRNPRSLDWNPLKFKLTEGTPDGPPVAGVNVNIYRTDQGNGGGFNRTLKSDTSGIVDAGLVNPGEYSFSLATATGHGSSQQAWGNLRIQPGSETLKHIVCPRALAEGAPVRFKFSWPAELEKEGLVLCVSLAYDSRRISEVDWHRAIVRSLLSGPATPVAEILRGKRPYLWSKPGQQAVSAELWNKDLVLPDESTGPFLWEVGTYQISSMLVLRPTPDPAVSATRKRYQVVAGLTTPGAIPRQGFVIRTEPPESDRPDGKTQERGGDHTDFASAIQTKRIPPGRDSQVFRGVGEAWGNASGGLEIRPGQVNEWTVSLWDELITLVRDQLESQKTSETQQ